jgi:hypothetical protein
MHVIIVPNLLVATLDERILDYNHALAKCFKSFSCAIQTLCERLIIHNRDPRPTQPSSPSLS